EAGNAAQLRLDRRFARGWIGLKKEGAGKIQSADDRDLIVLHSRIVQQRLAVGRLIPVGESGGHSGEYCVPLAGTEKLPLLEWLGVHDGTNRGANCLLV